jgi:hypothetical protein
MIRTKPPPGLGRLCFAPQQTRDEKVQLPGSPGRTLAEGEGRNNLIG